MNRQAERIRPGLGRLCQVGDQLTGGGLRALSARLLKRARYTGNRITGGGLRNLSKRLATRALRGAMSRPVLKALGRHLLQPFPSFSARLYQLGTTIPLLANSLYGTAFGHPMDPSSLAHFSLELEQGVSLERLAEKVASSAEFLDRHGRGQNVSVKYLYSLYGNGLGRALKLEDLATWLAEKQKGATRAQVLAAVAGSKEALEKLRLRGTELEIPYPQWVKENDTLSDLDRAVIRAHIRVLPSCPLISVIMPLEEADGLAWRGSLNSVITQLYPHWELFIVGEEVAALRLKEIGNAREDSRVNVLELNRAEDSSALANAALNLANGEFVTLLKAGDILPEHALYEMALELSKAEPTDILYTDSDQVGPDDKRSGPWFKPGWDPDLLLAQDYLSHSAVYRRTLIEEIGLLRSGLEGAAFHDLALRATAATTADRIRHIPSILYHKRSSGEEKAFDPEHALGTLRAPFLTRRVVRDYLDSQGFKEATIEPSPLIQNAMRVIWPIPSPEPLVSVIVPTRDKADLLFQCAQGVLGRTEYSNLELLIVDNGSIQQETLKLFRSLSERDARVRILHRPGPFNYSALNNSAASEARGEVLLLLNNDTSVIGSGWLKELVSHALRPDVGLVGAKLLYPNEKVQHAGAALGLGGSVNHLYRLANRNDTGYFGQLALVRTLSAVTGACVAIRRDVFFEVGGLDAVNLSVGFSDIDLCLKMGEYGYRIVWTPFAELFHLENASVGPDLVDSPKIERQREFFHMRKTWGPLVESADPFHNPNLLFTPDKFAVAAVPRRPKPWLPVFEQAFSLKPHLRDTP